MVGNTIEKIKQIGHDIAHSWYFRFWALSWLVFALVVFSALIILSKNSENANKQKDILMWVENATTIQFPRIHFRLDHRGNETLENYQCEVQGLFLTPEPCAPWRGFQPPQNQCVAFDSEIFAAKNDWTRGDARIMCTISTSGMGYNGNMMMAFEIEGTNVLSMGAQMYASLWIAPNDMAWVFLEKAVLQESRTSPVYDLWERNLIYHSTVAQPNLYNISVIMESFLIRHFEPKDIYNGWMTVGDIGGVAFFMVILHTMVMIIIGLFFSNTSSFLGGHEH